MALKVCVFCGSRFGAKESFAADAAELGRSMARAGFSLVYGGGDVGLMGVVSDAVMAEGGEAIGYIPRRLLEREVAKRSITRLEVTTTMFERKERMIGVSDAFVCLPGGLGTLDEMLEVMTLRQLGYHDCPIILLDTAGYWRPAMAMFEAVIRDGFADADAADLIESHASVESVMDRLRALDGAAADG